MKYKISIIIPVFNVENYIRNALESIVKQTIGLEYLEVIMVDDYSTDDSGKIIDEYASKYENYLAIHLPENSGAAGKPRNVGIKRASSEYLMFLDPDDYYAPYACEILYNKIITENVDIVSAKYSKQYENGNISVPSYQLFSIKESELKAEVIDDQIPFFITPPSIWTKIFKRSLLIKNNIKFPEGIPAQDLVFICHALLKANKIIFVNTSIVNYNVRNNENKSISFNRSKKYLLGLIKAYNYTYDVFKNEDKEDYFSFVLRGHLIHFTKQFILSDLDYSEQIEILESSWFLYKKYYVYDLIPPTHLKSIFDSIFNKKFENTILLADELIDLMKDQEKSPNLIKYQKKQKIFMLCDKLHVELGGLGRVVLNRSEHLAERGYDVTILTIEPDNDYEFIENELKKRNQLSPLVNLINIYNYYENKNSDRTSIEYLNNNNVNQEIYERDYQLIDEYYTERIVHYFRDGCYVKLKKWNDDGSLEYIEYFNETGLRIKINHYLNGIFTKEISYENNDKIRRKRYFTKDGFCYLTEMFNYNGQEQNIFLFDKSGDVISFDNTNDFHKYFITELCREYEDKPYLICDGSGPTPTIFNIDPDVAYLISQLHSNPYTGPYHFGGPMRNIGVLKGIEKLDAFITLTEKQRVDIVKQFGDYQNTYMIPNFVLINNELKVEKKPNKISIFSRISKEKNLADAVKAFKIVVNERENARLEIFGRATLPGEIIELKKLNELIKELQLKNNVFFKGYIIDVYKEMADSVAVILTSRFEGFGMVILESMLNSTPVISYDLNYGPSDIISHGTDGFLVEYNNIEQMAKYIIELMDDSAKAKKMGIAGRQKILKKYSEDVVIPQWEKLFETIPMTRNTRIINKNDSNIDYEGIKEFQTSLTKMNRPNNLYQKLTTNLYPLYIIFKAKNHGIKNAFINIRGYRAIKKNNLFDYDYYLRNNTDVRVSGADPIIHYIYHGFKEGRKPNPAFDADYYLTMYDDAKNSNLNPLVHYSLYGINKGRKTNKNQE